jgi:hypothetical protein
MPLAKVTDPTKRYPSLIINPLASITGFIIREILNKGYEIWVEGEEERRSEGEGKRYREGS